MRTCLVGASSVRHVAPQERRENVDENKGQMMEKESKMAKMLLFGPFSHHSAPFFLIKHVILLVLMEKKQRMMEKKGHTKKYNRFFFRLCVTSLVTEDIPKTSDRKSRQIKIMREPSLLNSSAEIPKKSEQQQKTHH